MGPLRTVQAAVDLTPAMAGRFSLAEAVVAAPRGGAYVSMAADDGSGIRRLATVGQSATGLGVTRSVPMPGLESVSGLFPSGNRVLATGRISGATPGGIGYGFELIDPASGKTRVTVVVPFPTGTTSSIGRSTLSPDGRTLYQFVSVGRGSVADEHLLAVDVATGAIRVDRGLGADLDPISDGPVGHDAVGLVARPGGGVTLVFDATPDRFRPERIPTLLTYDAGLGPVGAAVPATSATDGAQTDAIAAASDGTVFLSIRLDSGAGIIAVPDRGGAGPVLIQLRDPHRDYALVVEPAQVWGLVPAQEGARAIDLTTGQVRAPIDLGCPGQDVRAMVPGGDGGVLLIGVCNSPRTRTQMLWVVGP
ncbi:MAG: hypothetical protein QOJ68_458 [Blastococcus sp.]|nr:hypothetical protein [Blastococcus sp.]